MKLSILLLLLALNCSNLFSQTDKEKAKALGMRGVVEMDKGNFTESKELLNEAIKLDPDNVDYPYELALANYMEKNYDYALEILEKLTKHPDRTPSVYAMLGNVYDVKGDTSKAIKTYEDGLRLFPKSGYLYLERGNIELHKANYTDAVYFYELGVKMQPTFPSNYYRLARIFLSTDDEIWGLFYGELFMNLERNTKRTAEMSKMIFNTYKSEITLGDSGSIHLCKNQILDPVKYARDKILPFPMIYEPLFLIATITEKKIDIASLNRMRTKYIELYKEKKFDETHPNPLLKYHMKMIEDGVFEAYNYWLLINGDQNEFEMWRNINPMKWEIFVKWMEENPLILNESNYFLRTES